MLSFTYNQLSHVNESPVLLLPEFSCVNPVGKFVLLSAEINNILSFPTLSSLVYTHVNIHT